METSDQASSSSWRYRTAQATESCPSAKTSASTMTISPTVRLIANRPHSSSGVTSRMTTRSGGRSLIFRAYHERLDGFPYDDIDFPAISLRCELPIRMLTSSAIPDDLLDQALSETSRRLEPRSLFTHGGQLPPAFGGNKRDIGKVEQYAAAQRVHDNFVPCSIEFFDPR